MAITTLHGVALATYNQISDKTSEINTMTGVAGQRVAVNQMLAVIVTDHPLDSGATSGTENNNNRIIYVSKSYQAPWVRLGGKEQAIWNSSVSGVLPGNGDPVPNPDILLRDYSMVIPNWDY